MIGELSLSRSRDRHRPSTTLHSAAIVQNLIPNSTLESRITCSATPIAAQFDAIDNWGVRQIKVDGQNLLKGAGLGFIGSRTGVDNEDNISSASPHSRNGIMRAFNNNPNAGSLPYSLTFRRDANDPSKLFFSGSIGKSDFDFRTVSMPMDSNREAFTYWRHAGMSGVGRYDQNPYAYTPPGGGPIYIRFAPGRPMWGEIIGAEYTVRVTLTSSSRPMVLAFVEAPHLGGGVRNVEFSFGQVKKGENASISGYVQVFRTDPNLLPKTTFQTELHIFHQIGRRDGDGWSVNANDPRGYLSYGPYTTALPEGRRIAKFRLMLDNVTADNNRILTIDIYDANSGKVLASRSLTRRQFNTPWKYQDFELAFTAKAGQRIEARSYFHGGSYVRQDFVQFR